MAKIQRYKIQFGESIMYCENRDDALKIVNAVGDLAVDMEAIDEETYQRELARQQSELYPPGFETDFDGLEKVMRLIDKVPELKEHPLLRKAFRGY